MRQNHHAILVQFGPAQILHISPYVARTGGNYRDTVGPEGMEGRK